METTFVNSSDPKDFDAAITDKTKAIFAETVSNPSGEVTDLEGLADVAHSHHIPLIIDSTVATPYLCRPIEWGADVVTHSATKFLGGHGTTLGGVVVESGRFHWHSEKFPLFDDPVPSYGGLSWAGNFGEYAFLTRLRAEQLRDMGPTHAPHSAFLLAQGVETLPYRMQAHVDNARAVAEFMGHVEVPATLGRLSKGTWLLWRYQGSRSLGYYLARRDCLTALAHDLGVGEELVVPTAMAQLFEALVQLHSAGIVHRDVKVWGGAAAAPPLPPLARPPARTPPPFHTTRSPTM